MKVIALIDSGSTHNFIDVQVARNLQLSVNKESKFEVWVSNGEVVEGHGRCSKILL